MPDRGALLDLSPPNRGQISAPKARQQLIPRRQARQPNNALARHELRLHSLISSSAGGCPGPGRGHTVVRMPGRLTRRLVLPAIGAAGRFTLRLVHLAVGAPRRVTSVLVHLAARGAHLLTAILVLLLPAVVAAAAGIAAVALAVPQWPRWVALLAAALAAALASLIILYATIYPDTVRERIRTRRSKAFVGLGLVLVFAVAGSVLLSAATPAPTSSSIVPSIAVSSFTPTLAPQPTAVPSITVPPPPTEAPYSPGPQPAYAKLAHGAPPAPTALGFKYPSEPCDSGVEGEPCRWVRISWRWQGVDPGEVTIRIYALTTCLHVPDNDNVQCVIAGDKVPPADMVLVASASATSYACDFKMRPETSSYFLDEFLGVGGPEVYAYLVQAVDRHGGSRSIIAVAARH